MWTVSVDGECGRRVWTACWRSAGQISVFRTFTAMELRVSHKRGNSFQNLTDFSKTSLREENWTNCPHWCLQRT